MFESTPSHVAPVLPSQVQHVLGLGCRVGAVDLARGERRAAVRDCRVHLRAVREDLALRARDEDGQELQVQVRHRVQQVD